MVFGLKCIQSIMMLSLEFEESARICRSFIASSEFT